MRQLLPCLWLQWDNSTATNAGSPVYILLCGGLVTTNNRKSTRLDPLQPETDFDWNNEGAIGDRLSAREVEILGWFAAGKSAADVADILGISPATVMFHYRNVAARLGTLNRTHTVTEAVRRGLIRLG